MSKLKRLWYKIIDGFPNIVSLPLWLPFVETKMAVLYATFAGILLSAGMGFVLWVFGGDVIRPWGLQQKAGLLLISASLMISLVAWWLQFFEDRLGSSKKDKNSLSLGEKRTQFFSWNSRWLIWVSSLLASILFVWAFWVLACATGWQPTLFNSNPSGG